MNVRDYLMAGELMVAEHPPFYLTTLRIVHYEDGPEGARSRALPLERLMAVEVLKATRHNMMIGGGALILSGVFLLLALGLVTSFLAILGGVVAMAMGAMGKTAAYQIRAHNLPEEDEALWRLPSWGADRFVTRIRNIIGERTGF